MPGSDTVLRRVVGRFFFSFVIVLVGLLCGAVRPVWSQHAIWFPSDTLRAADYDANTYVPFVRGAGKIGTLRTADFEVRFSGGWPADARQAFQAAADIWASHIESSVPIIVDAEWASLDEGVLGSAGPYLLGNFGVGLADTWYPAALANSLVDFDLDGGSPDIGATFNSDFEDWYFGVDGNPPAGMYDFLTVVLHELGHGLGFTGSFEVDDGDPDFDECPGVGEGYGCWGIAASRNSEPYPFIFDHFTEDANGMSMLSYPSPSLELGQVLQSGEIYFESEFSRILNDDIPVSLYSPTPFEAGSSFSHLDEQAFPFGTVNSLMTPFLGRREVVHSPGPLTCAIFQEIGWPLGADCIALVSTMGVVAFDVNFASGDFILNWQLGNTAELERVEVQRSYADEPPNFATIRVFNGNAIQNSVVNLHLDGLEPGDYVFRLKLTFEDGDIVYSVLREVTIPLTSDFSLTEFYPNPVSVGTHALLQVRSSQQVLVEVYNVSGRRIDVLMNRMVEGDQQVRVNLEADGWPHGIYVVRVTGETFATSRSVVYAGQ